MGSSCTTSKVKKNHDNSSKLSISSYTWTKNSHNLFDFESNQKQRFDYEIDQSSKFVQINNDLIPLGFNKKVSGEQELFKIASKNDGWYLVPDIKNFVKNDNLQIWQVIRDNKEETEYYSNSSYNLQVGDQIKLGRVLIKVQELVIINSPNDGNLDDAKQQQNNQNENKTPAETEQSMIYEGQEERPCCRICLSETSSIGNPLISPCQCSGSMKYLHVKCIQKWVGGQVKTKNANSMMLYYWKKLKCELCKNNYKMEFKKNGFTYNILDIQRPKTSYVMFQINSKEKNRERGIYVIELNKKNTVKIGRVQDCDIKLNDISVSRQHATISLCPKENILKIQDNQSKFGSLILVRQPINITKLIDKSAFQIGKFLLNFDCVRKSKKKNQISFKKISEELEIIDLEKEEEQIAFQNLSYNMKAVPVFDDDEIEKGDPDDILVYEVAPKVAISNKIGLTMNNNNNNSINQNDIKIEF